MAKSGGAISTVGEEGKPAEKWQLAVSGVGEEASAWRLQRRTLAERGNFALQNPAEVSDLKPLGIGVDTNTNWGENESLHLYLVIRASHTMIHYDAVCLKYINIKNYIPSLLPLLHEHARQSASVLKSELSEDAHLLAVLLPRALNQ